MEMFLLYLVFVLDGLYRACFLLMLFMAFISTVSLGIYAASLSEDDTNATSRSTFCLKWCIAILVISSTVVLFTPSKEQAAVIYFGPKIYNGTLDVVNSEKLGTFGDKMFKVLEKKLDEELNFNEKEK